MSYKTFESRMLQQKRVDTDGFPEDGVYQCVDLPKQFLHEEKGLPKKLAYGNAKYWWLNTHPKVLEVCDKLPAASIKAGDIVPLRPVDDRDSHSAGHIGIATGARTATTVEILEQNGSTGSGDGQGKNSIRKRFVPMLRVYGVLRLKTANTSSANPKMPPVRSRIQLIPGQTRTTFKAGTDVKAGEIHVKDNTYIYTVRSVRNYRIGINSASGGGNGVELALYYKDGKIIPGWKV